MNIQRSDHNINQKLFEYLSKDSLLQKTDYRQEDQHHINNIITDKASFNAHNMGLPSTLRNGLCSDVQPSTTQPFIPYPNIDQPFHGYSSKIADAFASNKKHLQENLHLYMENPELKQSNIPDRMQVFLSGCKRGPRKWQDAQKHTMVPSMYDHGCKV